MKKYKISALLGIVLMGISSFIACLSEAKGVTIAGNIGLIASLAITSYGFSHWQP